MLFVDGAGEYLVRLFQQSNISFYVGLCGNAAALDFSSELVDITDEPSTVNGYARIALTGNATNWPILALINNMVRMQSKQITFTAVSGDFDKPITRHFLCNTPSGTAGKLFSMSGALPEPLVISPGTPFNVISEQWMGQ